MKSHCIVIPAIKKNAVIPDQLVKKLAGTTLIERALNTARACAPGEDIIVLTDSEEIGLICERAGVRHIRNAELRFNTWDILAEMHDLLHSLANEYESCIILRPSCPLLTWVDVDNALKHYRKTNAAALVTVKKVRQRLWKAHQVDAALLLMETVNNTEQTHVIETRALFIIRLATLAKNGPVGKLAPWYLDDRSLEILDYQDWWICERLLERRHMVFVVAGYPAIGLGHVYRALMLAHEISTHKITFVCTRESSLAVESIAARDYHVVRQGNESLAETVLSLRPDLVVNDILNTSLPYMDALSPFRCVNFEDEGPGAERASLVINALLSPRSDSPRVRCGPAYFCLRDEFLNAVRNPLRTQVHTLLISFGGTDQHNATLRVLNIVHPVCLAFGIAIRIVAGPGYAHRETLEKRIQALANPLITFTWATNIMSRMMEGADLAICSAGRTVYELAHMRVPGIVLATHEREATHTFARPRNGFAFAGIMTRIPDHRIRNLFLALLKQKRRSRYWEKQNALDFSGNKERVTGLLLNELEQSGKGREIS